MLLDVCIFFQEKFLLTKHVIHILPKNLVVPDKVQN
jgi:hypothetical protein